MAQVIEATVRDGDFDFHFIARPRKTGNSLTPFLAGTIDHGSSTQDPDRKVSKETKRRAYALAAVIFNKFRG
ncbi:MAG TPA: hypothetical protein P5524_02205 [Candidatus Paceibacterota bacterium]|nr:hypothetical protein [Candidatus Paceibacterota bacterium]